MNLEHGSLIRIGKTNILNSQNKKPKGKGKENPVNDTS
jgi:hypothetical protein